MAKNIVPPSAASKTFRGTKWLASRPAALALLVEALDCGWGVYAVFHGTEQELIAAGVANPAMFQDIGKSGKRTRSLGTGDSDKYTIRKQQRGQWTVEIRTFHEHSEEVKAPTDDYPQPSAWWRKHGGEVQAETAAILACLRETRKVTHG